MSNPPSSSTILRLLLFLLIWPPNKSDGAILPNGQFSNMGPSSVKAPEKEGRMAQQQQEFFGRVKNVQMTNEQGIKLFQHWIDQAMSSLLAAIANKKLKAMSKSGLIHSEFGKCSISANSVPLHAKCVSKLLIGGFEQKKARKKMILSRFERYKDLNGNAPIKRREEKPFATKMVDGADNGHLLGKKPTNWVGQFRMLTANLQIARKAPNGRTQIGGRRRIQIFPKMRNRARRQVLAEEEGRIVVKKDKYELHNPTLEGRLSPIGSVAKLLMAEVLKAKGRRREDVVPWQQTIDRLKQITIWRRKNANGKQLEDVLQMDKFRFRDLQEERRQIGSTKEEARMEFAPKLPTLLAKEQSEKEHKPANRIVQLLRQAIRLGYSLAGQNGTKIDAGKTLRTLSPRFLSISPNGGKEAEEETVDLLSPSLFSLHPTDAGDGPMLERLTNLPNLAQHFGTNRDQQQWMDFIIEAAGVAEHADQLEQEINLKEKANSQFGRLLEGRKYEREVRSADGTPLYFTKENITNAFGGSKAGKCAEVFERLTRSLDGQQLREMNASGYALLSPAQIRMLYGPKSPYNNSEALHQFTSFHSSIQLDAAIERDVHALAQMEHFEIRQKDIVASPILFTPFIGVFSVRNPVILSPILFSPLILSPSVLGPIILSPWMFVPLVLSPRVMSPLILSPLMFDPIILSPLAIHPTILSPGLFNPLVLNPFLLAPIILSPQVFTPIILSPLALSPFILNPNVGSPLILSPYVLSPIIFSPQFLSALVLSPYALSPVVASPLTAFSVILSPSWLS